MHPTGSDTARTSLEERYRVLLDIGRTLTSTLSSEDLYRAIYRETTRILEADGFFISLYDASTDLATVVFYADGGEERRAEITYKGSDSAVIRDERAVLVEDRLEARSLKILGDERQGVTRSAVSAPLRRGRVLGTISCQSYRPSAYTAAELELLQGVADVAAVAVENASYVAELERKTREAEQVEHIGRALVSSLDPQEVLGKVAEAARDLLGAGGASVWLFDPAPRVRVAASVGSAVPPIGATWDATGTPLDELAAEGISASLPAATGGMEAVGAGLAVALRDADRIAGALYASLPEAAPAGAAQVAVLERLASQASVALENARLHASVQSLSLTDPLTGLANRRHLRMHLDREVAAARRGRTLAAVIFDLDNFKLLNDTLGHIAGDEALKTFARILDEENRAMNLVARFGGDEFVSILSDTSGPGAERYVRRVRERLLAEPGLAGHPLAVSCGLALFDRDGMKRGEDLLRAADEDLYRSRDQREDPT